MAGCGEEQERLFDFTANESNMAPHLDARQDAPPGVALDGRDAYLKESGDLLSSQNLVEKTARVWSASMSMSGIGVGARWRAPRSGLHVLNVYRDWSNIADLLLQSVRKLGNFTVLC